MGAAYFIGAALACIVRRSLFAGRSARANRRTPRRSASRGGAARGRPGPLRAQPWARAGAADAGCQRHDRSRRAARAGPGSRPQANSPDRCRPRGRPQQARRSPLRADRRLDAARRQAHRRRARARRPHQSGELDRAGAGAGQGRRDLLCDAPRARRGRQCRADAGRRRAAARRLGCRKCAARCCPSVPRSPARPGLLPPPRPARRRRTVPGRRPLAADRAVPAPPTPAAGRADPPGGAGDARQSAAHQRHRRRGREAC